MCNTKCDTRPVDVNLPTAQVFKNAWFGRFAAKHGIPDALLLEAVKRAEAGLIDANLGAAELTQLLANGTLEKIEHNEQKVPLERTRRSS